MIFFLYIYCQYHLINICVLCVLVQTLTNKFLVDMFCKHSIVPALSTTSIELPILKTNKWHSVMRNLIIKTLEMMWLVRCKTRLTPGRCLMNVSETTINIRLNLTVMNYCGSPYSFQRWGNPIPHSQLYNTPKWQMRNNLN